MSKSHERIFDQNGNPLGSGYIGVGTGKLVPDPDNVEVLRSVFSLPPSNELQIPIEGDVGTLPYQGIWQGLVYDDPSIMHWFSDDMVASFFFFRMPPPWAPVFALERDAPGWAVNSEEDFVPIGLTIVEGIVSTIFPRAPQG